MKKLLLLIFITASLICKGQNYQCLQAGVKHYFTNGNGYLRGIRIDSVRTMGDTTVYYPFHTPRGYVNSITGYWDDLDPNAGSWLGKRVLQLNDGTFLFDNLWHDTVVIKSMANIGDTWIFYNDTTTRYYQAEVTGTDTMTVLGSVDSIKTILITAHDTSGIVVADPVNNFRIVLSKNYGFVQIFDLYTFPYHGPDSLYNWGIDYYLDYISGPSPSTTSAAFSLIPFNDPPLTSIYNFAGGDVYEFHYYRTDVWNNIVYSGYIIDSIISKTVISSTQVAYNVHSWEMQRANGFAPFTITSHLNDSVNIFSTPLIDTNKMPEEKGEWNIYYCYPGDTAFCFPGDRYKIITGISFNTFEPCGETNEYVVGLGNTLSDTCINPPAERTETRIFYIYKNGFPCGTFIGLPTIINNIQNFTESISISPNPATEELTIKTTTTTPYTITLQNMLGQTLQTTRTTRQEQTLNVTNLPAGVYNVSITDESGNRYNERVVIIH